MSALISKLFGNKEEESDYVKDSVVIVDQFEEFSEFVAIHMNIILRKISPNTLHFFHKESREGFVLSTVPTWDTVSLEILKSSFYVSSLFIHPVRKTLGEFVNWIKRRGNQVKCCINSKTSFVIGEFQVGIDHLETLFGEFSIISVNKNTS